ncbi:MAG: hypothetical protein R3276_14555 [Marinobacter sp.]|nr:hypothetical protein [Marinobacter sp.]
MSAVTGQAFISIDRQYHPDSTNSTSYTRVNLGMEIDIQSTTDTLELGRYDRTGEVAGTADVLINDFGLGYINNQAYFDEHPDAPRQLKPDGTPYAENELVPFFIDSPFLEFAFDEDTQEVVGVRLGLGNAMGILSGSISTLTGNVNIDIRDEGEGLTAANSEGNLYDQIVVALAPYLTADDPLLSHAQLVYGNDEDPRVGELDPIRGEYVGVPNGEEFIIRNVDSETTTLIHTTGGLSSSEIWVDADCFLLVCGPGDVHIIADDCRVLGIDACFELNTYNSFPIGQIQEIDGERRLVAPESGAFISFQTKDLEWLKDVANTNPTAADFLEATAGAFFNIPNGVVEVNLEEALNGTARYRSEYIDRGRGLF